MGKKSKISILQSTEHLIKAIFKNMEKRVFTYKDIQFVKEEYKIDSKFPYLLSYTEFLKYLRQHMKLNVSVLSYQRERREAVRYYFEDVSELELALSLSPKAYLTHYSAMAYHGLTENIVKTIYVNVEQTEKYNSRYNAKTELEQESIDEAFSKPLWKTSNIVRLSSGTQITLINGQFTNSLNVLTKIDNNGSVIRVTNIERTLVDCTIRPEYSGGILEVLNAYKSAREDVYISKIYAFLNQMDYIYPYQQCIGFLLEMAGYSDKQLRRFSSMEKKYDFYLARAVKKNSYSMKWRLYYPKHLDNLKLDQQN